MTVAAVAVPIKAVKPNTVAQTSEGALSIFIMLLAFFIGMCFTSARGLVFVQRLSFNINAMAWSSLSLKFFQMGDFARPFLRACSCDSSRNLSIL